MGGNTAGWTEDDDETHLVSMSYPVGNATDICLSGCLSLGSVKANRSENDETLLIQTLLINEDSSAQQSIRNGQTTIRTDKYN